MNEQFPNPNQSFADADAAQVWQAHVAQGNQIATDWNDMLARGGMPTADASRATSWDNRADLAPGGQQWPSAAPAAAVENPGWASQPGWASNGYDTALAPAYYNAPPPATGWPPTPNTYQTPAWNSEQAPLPWTPDGRATEIKRRGVGSTAMAAVGAGLKGAFKGMLSPSGNTVRADFNDGGFSQAAAGHGLRAAQAGVNAYEATLRQNPTLGGMLDGNYRSRL